MPTLSAKWPTLSAGRTRWFADDRSTNKAAAEEDDDATALTFMRIMSGLHNAMDGVLGTAAAAMVVEDAMKLATAATKGSMFITLT